MKPLVARYEILAAAANGDSAKEAAVDEIGNTWYLANEDDDLEAIWTFTEDLTRVEKKVAK